MLRFRFSLRLTADGCGYGAMKRRSRLLLGLNQR
jgi:hypothetical protein